MSLSPCCGQSPKIIERSSDGEPLRRNSIVIVCSKCPSRVVVEAGREVSERQSIAILVTANRAWEALMATMALSNAPLPPPC